MAKLSEKQQRFVAEYLVDLNGTQAAIRTGYSVKTANEQAARLLANVSIQQAIAEAMAERSRRTGVNQDRVVLELAKIAFLKMTDVVDGTMYKVDGKHVILRPTKQEREVADVLSVKYGKSVELVPQVMVPQGVQTPDYLVDGERFDLKAPTGRGKDLFYNVVSKKRKQASSFIFDITDCPLSEDEVRKQVEALFFSRHTRFIEKIVIMRGGEILKVYGRK